MACTDIDLYADIQHCTGEVNMPGTREYCYYIKKSQIASWPSKGQRDAEAAALASIVTIKEDFGLASDAKWNKIALSPDQNSFKCESQGSWGSKTFNNQVTLVMPGTGEEATGLCAAINNDDTVFLVPQRNGKFRLFGNEAFQTVATPSQESGAAAASDSAQTKIDLSVTDDTPAPFYQGKIVTSSGTISGKDGKPVVGS